MDKKKLTKAQKYIEHEIEWYKTSKDITKIMRKLGKLGFMASGHGSGFSGEDFSFIKKLPKNIVVYVNISDRGRFPKCSAYVEDQEANQDDPISQVKETKSEKFFPALKKLIKEASDA